MSGTPNQKPIKRQIKEAIRGVLIGKTDAKNRVSISQTTPTDDEEVPAILIYAVSENVNRFNQSPKDYKRVLTLTIECISNGNHDDDLDVQLENLGEQVEAIMEMDETLGDLVDRVELTASAYATSEEGSTYMGSLFLTYDVVFYTNAIRPGSVCYKPLEEAHVTTKSGPLNEYESTDIYTFEQGD